MLRYIPTFYVAEYLSGQEWPGKERANQEFRRTAEHMALCFRDYLFMAALGESRHSTKITGVGMPGFNLSDRDAVFVKAKKYGPTPENLDALHFIFQQPGWGSGYGGAKWDKIVDMVGEYEHLSPVLFTDKVVNARHNGGLAFNKTEAQAYMNIVMNDFNGSSLDGFLDYRRQAECILDGFLYYYLRVGLTVGRLMLQYAAFKHLNNSFSKMKPLPDANYKPVGWQNEALPKSAGVNKKIPHCPACNTEFTKDSVTDTCHNCGKKFCESCLLDFHDEAYCESCKTSIMTQECSLCHTVIGNLPYRTMSCGTIVHDVCAFDHVARCYVCTKNGSHPLPLEMEICEHCALPIPDPDDKSIVHTDSGLLHLWCYKPHVKENDDTETYTKSAKLYDSEMWATCVICKMPVHLSESLYIHCPHYHGQAHQVCNYGHKGHTREFNHCCSECDQCYTISATLLEELHPELFKKPEPKKPEPKPEVKVADPYLAPIKKSKSIKEKYDVQEEPKQADGSTSSSGGAAPEWTKLTDDELSKFANILGKYLNKADG